jgi:phage internal scaffolding protein
MKEIKFRTAYGPKKKSVIKCEEPTMTKQSHKDECDVNLILKRYDKNNVLTHMNKAKPFYADTTAIDLQQAIDTVDKAKAMFDELPSKIRNRFQGNPAALLDFLHNPANEREAVEIGLLEMPPQPPAPQNTAPPAPQNTAPHDTPPASEEEGGAPSA